MRLRHNKTLVAQLLQHSAYVLPERIKKEGIGNIFSQNAPLFLELGCGFGTFSRTFAAKHPDKNILAVDVSRDVLSRFVREVEQSGQPWPGNLLLSDINIFYIGDVIGQEPCIEDIFVFFCNPWPKRTHNIRRLTHTRQIRQYKRFLKPGGRIYFKTDDRGLYEATLKYINECNCTLLYNSENFVQEEQFPLLCIQTEYEKKFRQSGQPIYAAVAENIG